MFENFLLGPLLIYANRDELEMMVKDTIKEHWIPIYNNNNPNSAILNEMKQQNLIEHNRKNLVQGVVFTMGFLQTYQA